MSKNCNTEKCFLCLLYNGTVHYGSLIIDTKTVPFYKDLQKSIGKKRVRCSYSLLRPVISIEIRGTRLAWFSMGVLSANALMWLEKTEFGQ